MYSDCYQQQHSRRTCKVDMNSSAASTATYWPASFAVRKGVITYQRRPEVQFEAERCKEISSNKRLTSSCLELDHTILVLTLVHYNCVVHDTIKLTKKCIKDIKNSIQTVNILKLIPSKVQIKFESLLTTAESVLAAVINTERATFPLWYHS